MFVFYPSNSLWDWGDLFDEDDRENVVLDTHFYTAWNGRSENIDTYC